MHIGTPRQAVVATLDEFLGPSCELLGLSAWSFGAAESADPASRLWIILGEERAGCRVTLLPPVRRFARSPLAGCVLVRTQADLEALMARIERFVPPGS